MSVPCIEYADGYKYQLKKDWKIELSIQPPRDVNIGEWVSLSTNGLLKISAGYAWDGPSGPTVDTLTFMRGSLVHDALYQLMREGGLDKEVYRKEADRILREICKVDGMSRIRAWWVYTGVRLFGDPSADPKRKHGSLHAPEGCTPSPPAPPSGAGNARGNIGGSPGSIP